ncbi:MULTISPECIES: restriction endonuclease [unclassified Mycobacterium]|uniref:restriction endonuclease n=1 Tax=unclassified Mycobacterium TaxID=2642494 RepID=UPI0029C87CBD|nr:MULTISPECIES: restriction endonuclease [unclassified Mycobacterium]
MARVEWTRLSGEETEAVVGMLICSKHPNAVRVRPSQGDGGVDIFVPGAAGFGNERAVYQVKSYNKNLTSTQKRAIKKSYTEVIKTSEEEGWVITEWHLVMPIDLTDVNLGWLDAITARAEFPCETNGLLFCDTQAANFPKVIDYYLHDGKDRLQATMNQLTAIASGRRDRPDGAPLVAADVVADLSSIHKALNAYDPFYRYDYAVSDTPPPVERGPGKDGLVAVYAMEHESVWITVEIFALSLAALVERPIGGEFTVAIPAGDEQLRAQFERFIDYGSPMTMPAGTVSGSLDLPGGLGGELSGASLQVLSAPCPGDDHEPAELSLAVVAPDSDTVIASTVIRRTDLSVGQAGVRSVFTEKAGLFTLEMLVQVGELKQGQMNLQVQYDLAGCRPADVVDGLELLAAWREPNRIAMGLTYGPPNYGVLATDPIERDTEAARWAPIAKALAALQDHVGVRLKMPSEMTKDQAIGIIEASKLVLGEPVTSTITGTFTVTHTEPPQIDRQPDRTYEFVAINQIKFELGDDVIEVGKQALFFLGQYAGIKEHESEIKPLSKGFSIRYSGDAEVTHVSARHFQGNVTVSDPPEGDDSTIGAVES